MSSLLPESSAYQHGGSDGTSAKVLKLFWNKCEHKTTTFPPKLDLTDGNLADSFRKRKRYWKFIWKLVELLTSQNSDRQRLFCIVLARKFSKFTIISSLIKKMTKTIPRKSLKNLKSTVTREKMKFSKVFASGISHSTSHLMCF